MNEPVAYIDPYDLERLPYYDCHIGSQQLKNGIPLYTHPVKELKNIVLASATCSCGKVMEVTNLQPVKELTDEEIRHIQAICHLKDVGYDGFIMRFARAILRRANEK